MSKLLSKMLENKRVPHLMLLTGDKDASLQTAINFAKEWLSHGHTRAEKLQFQDLHLLKAEGKSGMHSIQAIRELIDKAAHASFEGAGKVFIIAEAERMLPTSANALLKIIEEPPPRTLILLLSTSAGKLLPTIRSRSQLVRLPVASKKTEQKAYEKLFTILQQSPLSPSLVLLSDCLEEIQAAFDKKKKVIEKEGSLYSQETLKEMNATQRQRVEQEIEGLVATKWMQEVEELLLTIADFYRGCPNLDLGHVGEALSRTKLALERSTPLKNALEAFFIRISI